MKKEEFISELRKEIYVDLRKAIGLEGLTKEELIESINENESAVECGLTYHELKNIMIESLRSVTREMEVL